MNPKRACLVIYMMSFYQSNEIKQENQCDLLFNKMKNDFSFHKMMVDTTYNLDQSHKLDDLQILTVYSPKLTGN